MKKNTRITSRNEDFSQWYTDVVKQSGLIEYGQVAGTMILKPLTMSIWETMQKAFNDKFEKMGVDNVNFPLLMPMTLLEKEKDHISGFAPEVAQVTKMGENELETPLLIRPTSEALFCDYFSKAINSHKDLPLKYNQWVNVFRAEKTTRPFLRNSEFQWQEGHTVHNNPKEASTLAKKMIKIYQKVARDYLAIPSIIGEKTVGERFAGAQTTYTIEALMPDGRALQSGTSHYFGTNFSVPFDIKFLNKNQKLEHAYQSSWGVSTRLIGALIMTHSDDMGLVIPPKVVKNKVVINTIMAKKNPNIIIASKKIKTMLSKFKPVLDDSDKGPGFKAAQAEIKGFPIRVEVGPRDLENNQVVVVRRDTLEKTIVDIDKLKNFIKTELELMQKSMLAKAEANLLNSITKGSTKEELISLVNDKKMVLMPWSGSAKDEKKLQEETGITPRCKPFGSVKPGENDLCFFTGKKAKKFVYFAKAY